VTPTIKAIPPGLTGDQLIVALNDRLRAIALLLTPPGPTSAKLDMRGFGIVNLADAVNAQDALNMETADKRYLTASNAIPASATSKTIIMQSTGNVAVGNLVTPAFTTTLDPSKQYIMDKAYISVPAQANAPTGSSLIIDPVVLPAGSPAGTAYQKVLTSPLVLPAGQIGPVTAQNFINTPLTTTELDMWNANVLQVGSTFPGSQVFIGLRVTQIN
jgi:hypothetical protein